MMKFVALAPGAAAIALLAFAASLLARAQQPASAGAAPQKALVPVAASTLAENPDPYYGETVSLTGAVERSLSKLAFSVDQDKSKPAARDVLVLTRTMNAPVDVNAYVTVIGEVVRFEPDEVAQWRKDYALDLAPDVIEKYRGRPAILATSVITSAGDDIARRLPPPLTPAEEAFDKVMKQVGSANRALRAALEGSDAAAARENAAALQKAFGEAGRFWKSRGTADAESWSEDGRKLAETIDHAAAAGRWDEVKTTLGTLGQVCQTCHTKYRERFDDGTFRIKLPADLASASRE
jgi:cytochrome c556